MVIPCIFFSTFHCIVFLLAGSQDTIKILRAQLDSNIVGKENSFNWILLLLLLSCADILSSSSPLPNGTNNLQSVLNARRLYNSCIDELTIESEGVEELLSLINNEFGGWPILQAASWNASSFNLSRLLFKLREYNHNIIYSFNTITDEKNSSTYYIRVRDRSRRDN